LILVAAGAGGHAGGLSPFALVGEVRKVFQGPIVLSGAISNGAAILAAQAMGADFCLYGTRLLPVKRPMLAMPIKMRLSKLRLLILSIQITSLGFWVTTLSKALRRLAWTQTICQLEIPVHLQGSLKKAKMGLLARHGKIFGGQARELV